MEERRLSEYHGEYKRENEYIMYEDEESSVQRLSVTRRQKMDAGFPQERRGAEADCNVRADGRPQPTCVMFLVRYFMGIKAPIFASLRLRTRVFKMYLAYTWVDVCV